MYLVIFQIYLELVDAYKCFKVKPLGEAGVGENWGNLSENSILYCSNTNMRCSVGELVTQITFKKTLKKKKSCKQSVVGGL